MKRFIYITMAFLLVMIIPMSGFAAETEDTVDPLAVVTVKCSISQVSAITAKISATTQNNTDAALVATAQLQMKINGSWVNQGTYITNSVTGKSVTASKTVVVAPGHEYRVVGTHKIGVTTKYTHSNSMVF